MKLTRHQGANGSQWAVDGKALPVGVTLASLLALPQQALMTLLSSLANGATIDGATVAPIEGSQELWGSGVTYLRSRDARKAESTTADVYQKVYDAERPEIFFKQLGWRTVGSGENVRIREDSHWNVPEPELTLVINAHGEIVGYTVGNDMSSRDIEGANPLYLPQAKTYTGSAAIGPAIQLADANELTDLTIKLEISRDGNSVFAGDTATSNMKRTFPDLAAYLCRELAFPHGVFLMTGTGIVPGDEFTLQSGDLIKITIGEMTLENTVA
ncbi:MAG TPA: fumarylacetoacetate hydrolase family protein [Caldilineaceae bacterium]|nr:fumarylacetoacetate hydrolase family protein [Caldilineaceae bacterium]